MTLNIRKTELQLQAVANARRIVILKELKKGKSMTVGELAEVLKLKTLAPASRHLRILKSAGIVEYKRRGKFVTYRLSLKQEEPIKSILAQL